VVVAGLLWLPGHGAEKNWDAPVKKWAKGPVSYLLTEQEEKSFKKLKAEEEREAFIQEFWERRNPREMEVPNPFRDRFLARVDTVDALLKKQGIPAGWKGDMGRVLILLGQSDEFRLAAVDAGGGAQESPQAAGPDAGAGTGGGPDGPRGQERVVKITMIYKDLTRLGLRANLELEFVKDGLSTRLETRVDLGTDAVRGLDREVLAQELPAGKEAPMEEFLSLGPSTDEPQTEAAAADALMDPVAQTVQRGLLLEALDGGELSADIPFESSVDVYKAKAGKTYVAISLAIEPAHHAEMGGESGLHPVAALRDQADPDNIFLYDSDDLFAPSEHNAAAGAGDLLRFQAGDGVKPGVYTMITGWVNDEGVSALKTQELVVPNFSAAFVQISSITLAESWEATDEPEGDLKRPYVLGNRRVVPKVAPVFPVNGDLALYYQIYNVAVEGGDPDLLIGYHVYRKRGSQFRKAATVPPVSGVKELVQIYELALKGWPVGEYKIKVNVTDNSNGTFDAKEVLFHIE
jgi:GWxTD domain-containing protein